MRTVYELTEDVENPVQDLVSMPFIKKGSKIVEIIDTKPRKPVVRYYWQDADFYFTSRELIEVLEPYLKVVDDSLSSLIQSKQYTAMVILAKLVDNKEVTLSGIERVINQLDHMSSQEMDVLISKI